MRTPNGKMYRLVALVIALVMLTTLALPAYAADSTDPITARNLSFTRSMEMPIVQDGLANGTVLAPPYTMTAESVKLSI